MKAAADFFIACLVTKQMSDQHRWNLTRKEAY
jgi:hypothetical protein